MGNPRATKHSARDKQIDRKRHYQQRLEPSRHALATRHSKCRRRAHSTSPS